MNLYKCHLVANQCYIIGKKRTPTGIVIHSTGANNPRISRYVQPVQGQTQGITQSAEYMLSLLGKHPYSNHWNQFNAEGHRDACVNAFIGKLANRKIAAVQTMPWDMEPWGCGSGVKGSYNRSHIQFEICEDDLNDQLYFSQVIDEAVQLCAFLCAEYSIPVQNVVSHHESYLAGYGNNHGDIDHWLKRFGMTMNDFRNKVSRKMEEEQPMTKEERAVFDKLAAKVDALTKENRELTERLDKYDKMGVYENAAIKWAYNDGNLPSWARGTVKKLTGKGYLYGNDKNSLELSYLMIRLLVILDRAGCFGE